MPKSGSPDLGLEDTQPVPPGLRCASGRRGESGDWLGRTAAYGFAMCQAPLAKPSPVVSPGALSFFQVYSGLPL